MIRSLYRCLIHLHPRHFREQFGGEMLGIFDEPANKFSRTELLADGLFSLVRQWTIRTEFQVSDTELTVAAGDGVPAFYTAEASIPRTGALIHGGLVSFLVFAVLSLAIGHEIGRRATPVSLGRVESLSSSHVTVTRSSVQSTPFAEPWSSSGPSDAGQDAGDNGVWWKRLRQLFSKAQPKPARESGGNDLRLQEPTMPFAPAPNEQGSIKTEGRGPYIPAAVSALPGSVALAAERPDFSGRWKLNLTKSDFGERTLPRSSVLVVEHREPNLKISRTVETDQGKLDSNVAYSTDGQETTIQLPGGPEVKTTAKWDGTALVIATRRSVDASDLTIRWRWTLSGDGKTLTTVRTLPHGDGTQTEVYDKQ